MLLRFAGGLLFEYPTGAIFCFAETNTWYKHILRLQCMHINDAQKVIQSTIIVFGWCKNNIFYFKTFLKITPAY